MAIKDLLCAHPSEEIRKIHRNSDHIAHCLAQLEERESNWVLIDSDPACLSG